MLLETADWSTGAITNFYALKVKLGKTRLHSLEYILHFISKDYIQHSLTAVKSKTPQLVLWKKMHWAIQSKNNNPRKIRVLVTY